METETTIYFLRILPCPIVGHIKSFLIFPSRVMQRAKHIHRLRFKRSLYALKFLGYSKPSEVVAFSNALSCPSCRQWSMHPSTQRRWRCYRMRQQRLREQCSHGGTL